MASRGRSCISAPPNYFQLLCPYLTTPPNIPPFPRPSADNVSSFLSSMDPVMSLNPSLVAAAAADRYMQMSLSAAGGSSSNSSRERQHFNDDDGGRTSTEGSGPEMTQQHLDDTDRRSTNQKQGTPEYMPGRSQHKKDFRSGSFH